MTRLAPLALALTLSLAPDPSPTPTAAPAAPPSMTDLRFLRMKISAGDLYSAESILQVHRAEKGEDGEYILGTAWLARGAALLGDWTAASRYARAARDLALARLGNPPDWENQPEAQYALGTSIEVEAQALVASGRKADAIRLLDESEKKWTKAPYNLRARIWKRRNLIDLVGQPAPPFRAEDQVGAGFTGLDKLRGKPVVLFFWWESCGDCKAEAAAFRRIAEKYVPRGVAFVAPTRYYEDHPAEEKAKIEKAWSEVYGSPAAVTVPISDEAMVRYGVSATPTFVFVDRNGIVSAYLPYRMTEERLTTEIEKIMRKTRTP
ncbi:MAG TPA: TlpA disulfide reductase family protein [Thermoanaerobaculia bacterium]|nr:TlpA disulfide reductase family protein [Thermoanaerobaculia bacterium]